MVPPRYSRAAILLFSLLAHRAVTAQSYPRTDVRTVIAVNAAIGGVTSAVHAVAHGKPVGRAFVYGAFGGGLHGSAKTFSPTLGYPAAAIGAVGASIVFNAGRGAHPLSELTLPLGPTRVRVTTGSARGVTAALSIYETAMLAKALARPATHVDWNRSLTAGTFVLRTTGPLVAGQTRAAGMTSSSVILLSDRARHRSETFDHERIHVQQHWFVQDVWGRSIENELRRRVGPLRALPRWLEIGGLPRAMLSLERQAIGADGPLRSWLETEAYSLAERARR